ncbi:MAG: hypothetical protein ABR508_04085 [Candidatus Baltobacteraceae bacterium]
MTALICAAASALLAASCSNTNNPAPLPVGNMPVTSAPASANFPITRTIQTTVSPAQSLYLVRGYIDDTRSNGFHLKSAGTGLGSIWVYTTSTTHLSYGGLTPKVGLYAVAVGSGSVSTYLTSAYAALYTAALSQTTITGELTSTQAYGYAIRLSSGVYVPLALSSSTSVSGSISLWEPVSSAALGSPSTGYAALTLSSSSTATPAPTPTMSSTTASSVPRHLLTADYLLGLYGTRSVTPAQAAPYLTWAQTSTSDSTAIHNAGIKTQVYIDPNWLATTDPMYQGIVESDFSHTCAGSRVTVSFGSAVLRDDTNPASSSNQLHFASWVSTQKALGHIDMILEDNAGPLSPYASYPNGMPCNYSSSSWVTGAIALNNSVSLPVMVNGLNAFTTSTAPNLSVVENGSNTAGGNLEGCYNYLNQPINTGNSWLIMENTELAVVHAGKLFECMGRDQSSASSNYAGRIFSLASFLLTYDPSHTMIASEWATTSGLHVMPETGLVPLDPLVSEPSAISSLKQTSGAYGRQYAHCYYRGTLVGACAIAVTHDYGNPEAFPFSGYAHTLTLSGAGVLDGGTASMSGPAPPSMMQPYTAVVAFK